jgi:dCTP deaminase
VRLSRQSILKEIELGTLKFDPPLEHAQVDASSIDLRLDNRFLYLDKEIEEQRQAGADVRWYVQEPWNQFIGKYGHPETIPDDGVLELERGKLILGFTLEYVQMPPYLAGRVEGKSSHARRGLLIHLTAPTIQSGWHGRIQLELYNLGPATLLLRPKLPICQLIIEQVTEPEQYEGQFQQQER